MPKRLTPLGKQSTKFRYLDRPAGQQPPGAPSIVWSSCVVGQKGKEGGGGGSKIQTAKGFTERGARLNALGQKSILYGLAALPTGIGTLPGIVFVTFGFITAAYSSTQYVQFSRPCSEKEAGF